MMGWANCGTDSQGRPIGYAHAGYCDVPGCWTKIDRGISYACGRMHGETDHGCERYFCEGHLTFVILGEADGFTTPTTYLCPECLEHFHTSQSRSPFR